MGERLEQAFATLTAETYQAANTKRALRVTGRGAAKLRHVETTAETGNSARKRIAAKS